MPRTTRPTKKERRQRCCARMHASLQCGVPEADRGAAVPVAPAGSPSTTTKHARTQPTPTPTTTTANSPSTPTNTTAKHEPDYTVKEQAMNECGHSAKDAAHIANIFRPPPNQLTPMSSPMSPADLPRVRFSCHKPKEGRDGHWQIPGRDLTLPAPRSISLARNGFAPLSQMPRLDTRMQRGPCQE